MVGFAYKRWIYKKNIVEKNYIFIIFRCEIWFFFKYNRTYDEINVVFAWIFIWKTILLIWNDFIRSRYYRNLCLIWKQSVLFFNKSINAAVYKRLCYDFLRKIHTENVHCVFRTTCNSAHHGDIFAICKNITWKRLVSVNLSRNVGRDLGNFPRNVKRES